MRKASTATSTMGTISRSRKPEAALLRFVIVNVLLLELCWGSVLPRPNVRQTSTTQITSVDGNNYTGERSIIIVTSSELPKQIPPPPTPTKPQGTTPKYADSKESFYNKKLEYHDKEMADQF